MLKPAVGPITVESRLNETSSRHSLAIERFLESFNAAAEAKHAARQAARRPRSRGGESGRRARGAPPVGSIGYTGSYREYSADVDAVSVVSVLETRGPV
jgi:hypothetical protein